MYFYYKGLSKTLFIHSVQIFYSLCTKPLPITSSLSHLANNVFN